MHWFRTIIDTRAGVGLYMHDHVVFLQLTKGLKPFSACPTINTIGVGLMRGEVMRGETGCGEKAVHAAHVPLVALEGAFVVPELVARHRLQAVARHRPLAVARRRRERRVPLHHHRGGVFLTLGDSHSSSRCTIDGRGRRAFSHALQLSGRLRFCFWRCATNICRWDADTTSLQDYKYR